MLTRLIYYSVVAEVNSTTDITQILEKASVYNKDLGLTGCLYFNEKYFVQILEGDRKKVSQLYNKIAKDKRHKNIVIIDVSPIASRDFEKWSILYLGKIQLDNDILLKFSPNVEFCPDEMQADNLIEFVLELKSKIQ